MAGDSSSSQRTAELGKLALASLKKASTQADYSHAADLFSDAIAIQTRAFLFFGRGKCFLALHQYQRALFDFSMSIRLESNTTSTNSNVAKNIAYRGFCYRSLGRLGEALKDYKEAIRLGGDGAGGYYYERTVVYYDLLDFPNAIEDLQSR
jgi:Tetratricopeptide repeat.